uniref:Uncharacterized protein n=1 Tax=mine drainage metagenome TaxID=410659 RepID=E6QGX1_9ZZZZ
MMSTGTGQPVPAACAQAPATIMHKDGKPSHNPFRAAFLRRNGTPSLWVNALRA